MWSGAASIATIKLLFLAATPDHEDATPLTELVSALAMSRVERAPVSLGEETEESIREGGVASVEPAATLSDEAKSGGGWTISVTGRVVDPGVEVCTMSMSVTGRIVGVTAVALTVSLTGGDVKSTDGVWPESAGRGREGREDEGETVAGLEGTGETADTSLTQAEVESNCSGWESLVEGVVVGVDSSPISGWVGMSEWALIEGGRSLEMLQSVTRTGEGAGDGGRLSCIGGVR